MNVKCNSCGYIGDEKEFPTGYDFCHERQAQAMGLDKPAKSSKYRNRYTVVDGIRFDSAAEARRWQELNMLERAGEIARLSRQPEYVILYPFVDEQGKKHRGIKYKADFRYIEGGRCVVEDVKGKWTREARLKVKLFRQHYPGIIFREVKAR